MSNAVQTAELRGMDPALALGGYRPHTARTPGSKTHTVAETGQVLFEIDGARPGMVFSANQQLRVMSYLLEDEWKAVDREVITASEYPLRVINDIRAAGLVAPMDPNVLVSTWYTQNDMTAAKTNMTGRGMSERDIPEIAPTGAPIPVTFKDLSFSTRGIGASRRIGEGIDLTMVSLAAREVAEKLEDMMVNGDSTISFGGYSLYGFLTEPNVTTDTAGNFGGGDVGTAGNAEKTIAGMLNSLNGENYRGPFTVYASETQYNQMMTVYNDTAGGDTTSLSRLRTWDSIRSIFSVPASVLADGKIIVAQMTRDVLEYAEGTAIQVREWQSGNGMEIFFRVMAIGGPRVKSRQNGESGIRVATGA